MVILKSHSVDEHIFNGDFPYERGIFSNILVVSDVMVVQELIGLSEELPESYRNK